MAFKEMNKPKYPPRLWALVAYPAGGKTTFSIQMRGPLVAIDSDHRFSEMLDMIKAESPNKTVYQLSPNPIDNVDTDQIVSLLNKQMPGADVGTIIVDSLTAIMAPLVTGALMDVETGRIKNRAAANRMKAIRMRQLQDGVTRWGTDVLWIWHLDDGRDGHGAEVTKETVSATELARLTRSINMKLRIVTGKKERHGIEVVWSRRGRSGMILWDDTGTWKGMPERIEAVVYEGLTAEELDQLATPEVFSGPEHAIDWAIKQGAFLLENVAKDEYQKIKMEDQPESAKEMAGLWTARVNELLREEKAQ